MFVNVKAYNVEQRRINDLYFNVEKDKVRQSQNNLNNIVKCKIIILSLTKKKKKRKNVKENQEQLIPHFERNTDKIIFKILNQMITLGNTI